MYMYCMYVYVYTYTVYLYYICIIVCMCVQSAQIAQMASTELFQALYFKSLASGGELGESNKCEVEAIVYSILSKGVMVFVPR